VASLDHAVRRRDPVRHRKVVVQHLQQAFMSGNSNLRDNLPYKIYPAKDNDANC
jgi:hypothetical protein